MFNPNLVRIFGTGSVYVGAYGASTLPTTLAGALDTRFTDLGYITEDGVTLAPELNVNEVMAWQSRSPIRITENSRVLRLTVPAMEFNERTLELYYGGGDAVLSGSDYVYTPPTPGTVSEWTVVFDLRDGTFDYRYVFDRAVLSEVSEIVHRKDEPSVFQSTLTILGGADGSAGWRLYSDDAAAFAGS